MKVYSLGSLLKDVLIFLGGVERSIYLCCSFAFGDPPEKSNEKLRRTSTLLRCAQLQKAPSYLRGYFTPSSAHGSRPSPLKHLFNDCFSLVSAINLALMLGTGSNTFSPHKNSVFFHGDLPSPLDIQPPPETVKWTPKNSPKSPSQEVFWMSRV